MEETFENDTKVFRGTLILNISRLLCAYLMHIQTYPEVKSAVGMLQYAINNHKLFQDGSVSFPIIIAFLKITGGFATEFGNLYLMARITSVKLVVKGYVTMALVAKTDNIMAMTIQDRNIK